MNAAMLEGIAVFPPHGVAVDAPVGQRPDRVV